VEDFPPSDLIADRPKRKLQKIVKRYHKGDIRDYNRSLFLAHEEFGDFLKFIELTMFFWDVLLVVSIYAWEM
jgi:hypothetical protein